MVSLSFHASAGRSSTRENTIVSPPMILLSAQGSSSRTITAGGRGNPGAAQECVKTRVLSSSAYWNRALRSISRNSTMRWSQYVIFSSTWWAGKLTKAAERSTSSDSNRCHSARAPVSLPGLPSRHAAPASMAPISLVSSVGLIRTTLSHSAGIGHGDGRTGRLSFTGVKSAGPPQVRAYPRRRKLPEIGRQPTERRHPAEDGQRSGDDSAPVPPVRLPSGRDAQGGVEQCKGEPGQHAELGIRQTEILLDGLDQEGEDLPVHEVEREDRQQDCQRVPPAACRYPVLALRFEYHERTVGATQAAPAVCCVAGPRSGTCGSGPATGRTGPGAASSTPKISTVPLLRSRRGLGGEI